MSENDQQGDKQQDISGQQSEHPEPDVPQVGESFPDGYIAQLKAVVVKPDMFFKSMPVTGGYMPAVVFLGITSAVRAVPAALVKGQPLGIIMECIGNFSLFVFLAGVLFVLSKAFGGQGKFEGTFKVACFSSAPKLITWIPIIGPICGFYAVYIQIVGLQTVQKLSLNKAIMVAGIPVVVMFVLQLIVQMIAQSILQSMPLPRMK